MRDQFSAALGLLGFAIGFGLLIYLVVFNSAQVTPIFHGLPLLIRFVIALGFLCVPLVLSRLGVIIGGGKLLEEEEQKFLFGDIADEIAYTIDRHKRRRKNNPKDQENGE